MIDFSLTDEQQLVRETARDFAAKEITPVATQNDHEGKFDTNIVKRLAEMGFLGAIFPEEYGGREIDYRTYGLIVEEIGKADAAARTVISVSTSLCGVPIYKFGTEEQKQRYLPGICDGTALACFGLTEPDTGSDAANQKTRATKTENGWKISGQKMFISLGNYAKTALIFAQTDPEKKHKGLACFLVPTDSPGFTAQKIHHKLGMHASDTAELSLDAVEVPDDAMLGEVGEGFKVAMTALESGRYSVAAGCVGICAGSLECSIDYAKTRVQFDRPIGSFQMVQDMIAQMVLKTETSRLLLWRAGYLKDEGKPNTLETSLAKLHASESAIECANLAIQVHGGSGYVDDYPPARYLRDARVTTLYEGTSQIQKLIIGRQVTGLNAMI
ncbi:MAG TPA: acyl-CoA dehydrogenase family protein [Solirubrobacterales bacterium]|jgi:alkylation response protein AidB-like acyl-CoA dehydrogenase|nr:acyl-CoA dehydrogenase family protein [Solirubrobacterales bacterium]